MKSFTLIILLALSTLSLYSQSITDTIEIRRVYGTQYKQHGKIVSPKKMLEIMQGDNMAYSQMMKAKDKSDLSMIFGIPGGFCIGYPIGTLIAGGTPNTTLFAIGAALTVVSVTLSISANRQATTAVGIFNEGLRAKGYIKPKAVLGMCNNGVGVTLKF